MDCFLARFVEKQMHMAGRRAGKLAEKQPDLYTKLISQISQTKAKLSHQTFISIMMENKCDDRLHQ